MSTEKDPTNPSYYKSETGLEAIHVIEAFGLGFCLGCVLKYIVRAGKKGDAVEDLKKAHWYLGREIYRREVDRRNKIEESKIAKHKQEAPFRTNDA